MAQTRKPTLRDSEARWTDRVAATSSRKAEESRERARELRGKMSIPELLLWKQLRGEKTGFKFRRQHVLGPYFADFYCHEVRLVVEVDGEVHIIRREHDAARDRWMAERGYDVYRVSASAVTFDVHSVVDHIARHALKLRASRQT